MGWRSFRSGLQTVHLWASFFLALPFIVIGLSGSLLALYAEWPDLGVPRATAKGPMQSMARMIAVAEAANPGARSAGITLPNRVGEAAAVQFARPPNVRVAGGGIYARTIFIDPVSLKILANKTRAPATQFNRRVHQLHEILMMPALSGTKTVGFLGIAMSLFGLTGLILWWPARGQWKRGFVLDGSLRGYRLYRELHSVFGFWFLIVFLVMSVSGVYLEFPQTSRAVVGLFVATKSSYPPNPVLEPSMTPVDVDGLARRALSVIPNAHVLSVGFPFVPEGSFMVTLAPNGFADDGPQISAFLSRNGDVVDVVDPRTESAGMQFMQWLRILHYGGGIGTIWKVMVFISGLLPLFFTITGFSMWWLRRVQRKRVAAFETPAELPVAAE